MPRRGNDRRVAASLDAPGVVEMTIQGVKKPLEQLSAGEVAEWLAQQGLGHLAESFKRHKICGKYLATLTKSDLKDMGIELVGDQKQLLEELAQLKRAVVRVMRDQILWRGTEQVYDNSCQMLLDSCCCLCPRRGETYTLTNQSLKIIHVKIAHCCFGLCKCSCFGVSQSLDNVDLNYIKDVDYMRNAGCCKDRGVIHIESDAGNASGTTQMRIAGADAPEVVTLIKNAVEDAKLRRERGRAIDE